MKKFLGILTTLFLIIGIASLAGAAPIDYTSTAGDKDFAANRDAYDDLTNMDYYVFAEGSSEVGAAVSNTGVITWNYILPYSITTAYTGSVTVRLWDIDSPSEVVDFYINGEFAGEVSGLNGGNVTSWNAAVANGTTASLSGWTEATFALSATTLAAISGTPNFDLTMVINENTSANTWAVVVDYATLNLNYEPGEENPNYGVPEPATMLLLGAGLLGLAAFRRRFVKK